ncbi:hypothetical protein [Streptomyces huiliensis]|nr:hypothetical protein [Streptomyces huiliensis]
MPERTGWAPAATAWMPERTGWAPAADNDGHDADYRLVPIA